MFCFQEDCVVGTHLKRLGDTISVNIKTNVYIRNKSSISIVSVGVSVLCRAMAKRKAS